VIEQLNTEGNTDGAYEYADEEIVEEDY